ncbi:MAG: hypothetical protein ACXVCP_09185 [Bdellovibrio sp.]
MRKLINAILIFCLTVPASIVRAEESSSPTEATAPVEETVVSFSESLFQNAKNTSRNGINVKDDSAFFCKDDRASVSSFDPNTLLSRYMFFFKKGNDPKSNNSNDAICAIYYRERYARTLFEVAVKDGKVEMTAKKMEERYTEQLDILKKMNLSSNRESQKAVKELVAVVQEYWLTKFITFAYLARSREFALNSVGGVGLTLGSVAGLVYFMAPKWADLAMKIPRLIFNLGMLARNALVSSSVGAGLGASFAAASGMPGQYNVEIWPSPLTVLNMPKDKVTIETENVGKDSLVKQAWAIGGSVLTGYVGWHLVEIGAHKAAGTEFVQLLLEGIKRSGGLTKQVFVEAINAMNLTNAADVTLMVVNTVKDSETMALLEKGYHALHGTATIGSLIITDLLIHFLKEYIREKTTEELLQKYQESKLNFNAAIEKFNANRDNSESSLQAFSAAQKMFESLRVLASHLLIPAYESVVEFSEVYRSEQTVPMTCNIAKMNVRINDDKRVQKFLNSLQKKEKESYLMAADALDQFETAIDNTKLYFFSNFFKRKLSLLKMSFFFDEKFGLETKQISTGTSLKEFGKGYIRVVQGEMAVNLQRMGGRLYDGIEEAKKALGKDAYSTTILNYLMSKDYLNAMLYDKCLKLEQESQAQ